MCRRGSESLPQNQGLAKGERVDGEVRDDGETMLWPWHRNTGTEDEFIVAKFHNCSWLCFGKSHLTPKEEKKKDNYTALVVMLCHHSLLLLFKSFVPGKPVEIEGSLCCESSFAPKLPANLFIYLMHFSITLCLLHDCINKKDILNILCNNNNLFSGQIFPTWDQLQNLQEVIQDGRFPAMEDLCAWSVSGEWSVCQLSISIFYVITGFLEGFP